MAIQIAASAVNALVSYLEGESLGFANILRGFPEHTTILNLQQSDNPAPVLSIIHAGEEWDWCTPEMVDSSGSGDLLVTYKLAYVRINAQMDLWAPYRATRDVFSQTLNAAMHNQLPNLPGLWIDQDDFYSRPLSINVVRSTPLNLQTSAVRGEWRQTWDLTIDTDFVVQTTQTELSEIILRLQSDVGGITLTNSDYSVT